MNPVAEDTLPPPSESRRDADGRLTRLSFASPNSAPTAPVWLVAIDGSVHAQRAVVAALRLADDMKACSLHLLHVQHWLSKEAAESELLARGLAVSQQARHLVAISGHPWQLHLALGSSAETIISIARELNCQGIVVGCRGLGTAGHLLLGSVSSRVIQLSPIPVLAVP
ncbi:MAG: universal stress protein [Betaproteobacteria bacterium HGW-Betaproteobacteria-7]|jgi:nucleotide-binding universal stress UspA family protein|nr:MAG: universal stress protein [Betaproteobacteria bacterium HGW-Betaproteobacteria-7]